MEEKFDVLNEWGEFTGKIATKSQCHKEGLWHRAVYAFIINNEGDILLQRRSCNKKRWPDMWDVTVGGHVLTGEFGREALIREVSEELGLEVSDDEIKYLVGSTSIDTSSAYINKHFNECYIITKNVDLSEIVLQTEEVSEVKFFSLNDILNMVNDDYKCITRKIGPWNFLIKILEHYCKKAI